MPDPRFFTRAGPLPLGEIARLSGSGLSANADPDLMIEDVAPLDTAGPHDLGFFDNKKYRAQFTATRAGACFVSPDSAKDAPEGTALLLTPFPYKAYARTAQLFYPEAHPPAFISPHAYIHEQAIIGTDCVIDHGAIIGARAEIGAGCRIESHAVIGDGVRIGAHSRIGVHASLSHCLIGAHVRIYAGARIGQDGFGFAIDPQGHVKVPQLGRVIIEDHCEIGANTCIDRGAGPDTVIGAGTWIDNLVQIGHNVRVGKGCILVAQSGVSGSTEIGDFAALGGQAGVTGHLKIGTGARIAAQSGVMRDVPDGEIYTGSPAIPHRQFMRQTAALLQLSGKTSKSRRTEP